MQTLALMLIAVASSTMGVAFPTINESSRSVVVVIETNAGEIGYLAEVETSINVTDRLVSFTSLLTSKGFVNSEDFELVYEDGIVSLLIVFEDYDSFKDFNGIDLTADANRKLEEKSGLFTIERTVTLSDPYTRFLDPATNATAQLMVEFNTLFNGGGDVDYGYVFASSVRRTSTNAVEHEVDYASGYWYYYYGVTNNPADTQEIVIFDRRANTPIWYGVAIVATAVFMGLFYLFSRKRVNQN